MKTVHKIPNPRVMDEVFTHFKGRLTGKLIDVVVAQTTSVDCCKLNIRTSAAMGNRVRVENATRPERTEYLNEGDSYSNGVCRVTVDRIDHNGHATVRIETISNAKRKVW